MFKYFILLLFFLLSCSSTEKKDQLLKQECRIIKLDSSKSESMLFGYINTSTDYVYILGMDDEKISYCIQIENNNFLKIKNCRIESDERYSYYDSFSNITPSVIHFEIVLTNSKDLINITYVSENKELFINGVSIKCKDTPIFHVANSRNISKLENEFTLKLN